MKYRSPPLPQAMLEALIGSQQADQLVALPLFQSGRVVSREVFASMKSRRGSRYTGVNVQGRRSGSGMSRPGNHHHYFSEMKYQNKVTISESNCADNNPA